MGLWLRGAWGAQAGYVMSERKPLSAHLSMPTPYTAVYISTGIGCDVQCAESVSTCCKVGTAKYNHQYDKCYVSG